MGLSRWIVTGAAYVCGVLLMFALPTAAVAVDEPQRLWQVGENCGDVPKIFNEECGFEAGAGFVETVFPRGVAADPDTGHVFVADQVNARVVQLDAWGQFIKAWGWGVRDGSAELQSCTAATGCLKGLAGSGPGQFEANAVQGVAVDSNGDVYVVDRENMRVQKFDPEPEGNEADEAAEFVLTFGGEVNKSNGSNLCTAASGNTCGAGVEGTGDGEFSGWLLLASFIASGPGDVIYVGDRERVQEFSSAGVFIKSIPLPGESVQSLAVDSTGNLYLSFVESIATAKPGVRKLSPTGEAICTAYTSHPEAKTTDNPRAIALDPAGGFYAFQEKRIGDENIPPTRIAHYGDVCQEEYSFEPAGLQASTGMAANVVTEAGESALYVSSSQFTDSFIRAYYPPPDKWPPPVEPPTIEDQYAVAATSSGATVRGEINPHFWKDTSYYVEYGPGKCSEGGCSQRANFPGALLGAVIVDEGVTTSGVFLGGLSPNTTYHYRFVAQSSGSGGQPVRGVGGEVGVDGDEASFTTFPLPAPLSPSDPCPNAAFRSGPSARLPDCRAYEMVSPVSKGEFDIGQLTNTVGIPARINQTTPDGNKLTYSTARPFDDPISAPWSSQYIATRNADGWATDNISPPRGGGSFYGVQGLAREVPFRLFSEDLCSAWMVQDVEVPLAPGAVPGYPNLYRRENCATPRYEPLTAAPLAPAIPEPSEYQPAAQGFSADGTRTVFRTNARLTDEASSVSDIYQLYIRDGAGLRLVSVLPNGSPAAASSSVGSTGGGEGFDFRYDNVYHAVSEDASHVYWSSGGKLYLRLNPLASGEECSAAETPCTLVVSGSSAARFWQARPDGSAALFEAGGSLFEYDAALGESHEIADQLRGVLGASEDLSRVYFASDEVLDGAAQPGQPNVYLYEEGSFRFIATLSPVDLFGDLGAKNAGAFSPVAELPYIRSSRVSSDGQTVAFTTAGAPTGYDNTDANSGQADSEVHLYDATADEGEGRLSCVSCNPTGARPVGRQMASLSNGSVLIWAAALLPGWETEIHPSRVLSDDGKRLFFESFEALVLADTNHAQDVYEWEAPGKGDCSTGDPTYTPARAGCVRLISSGQNPVDSTFVDASASGSDVFFTTRSSLVPKDPDLIDIYDARIGGGLVEPETPAECEGEACQGAAVMPSGVTPSSSTFRGPGNPRPKRCPRGKRKVKRAGKTRCVAKKRNRAQKNGQRRAAR